MIRLLELRNEKELSQREMAKELKISQGTYNNWENEKTQPSIEQLVELSKFFGVSVDYLIGNTEDEGTINNVKAELTFEEKVLLKEFRLLNNEAKQSLLSFLEKSRK